MTKSELISTIHNQFPTLTLKDVEYAINKILDEMGETLARNDRIEIRNFGSFKLNQRPPRIGRNPKTGERVEVPAKATPHFKPGLELRFLVDKD